MENFFMLYLFIGFFLITIGMFADWEETSKETTLAIFMTIIVGTLLWPLIFYFMYLERNNDE